ncbi:MAG: 7-cyano-7-deazaguanine synthase QueC [Desulfobaccales bacterium]|nr:7-cyano-7-deazaguanine synthase QueC [Desulfobaccales bacterium]
MGGEFEGRLGDLRSPSPPLNSASAKPLAVVLLSGGLDSCVAAALARQSLELALFHANYGQRTLIRELAAFRAQAAFFQVRRLLEADLNFLGSMGGSSLTDPRCPVPTGEAETPGIPSTYVPFRNSLLLAAAVAWAEVLGAQAIFIGANMLDNPGYPDCRPEYFAAFNRLIELGTRPETNIRIHTPLIDLDKAGIIRLGLELKAPLELTWSCYLNDLRACGQCSSCRLRLKGFAAAGVPDPITYEGGEK